MNQMFQLPNEKHCFVDQRYQKTVTCEVGPTQALQSWISNSYTMAG